MISHLHPGMELSPASAVVIKNKNEKTSKIKKSSDQHLEIPTFDCLVNNPFSFDCLTLIKF